MTPKNLPKSRLFFLDNLKILLIVLVILHHVGQAYGSTGGSWPISNTERFFPLVFLFTLDRSFFMSLFFLISGYFLPGSLARKGAWKYVKDRFARLGIPMIFFLVVVHAVLLYFLQIHESASINPTFWHYYWHNYWGFHHEPGQNPLFTLGPLWFISMLLVLSIGYVLVHLLAQTYKKINTRLTSLSFNQLLLLTIFAVIFLSFLVRIWFPIDRWLNYVVLAFAPADVVRDTAFFMLGIIFYRRNTLFAISRKKGLIWLSIAVLLAVFYILYWKLTGIGFFCGGGFSIKSFRYITWETLYCTGMCIGLLILFREFFNRTNKFYSALAESAFCAYLFHFEIVIILQYCFVHIDISPLHKFFVVSLLAVSLTFLFSYWIRKIPGVKKIVG